MQILCQTTGKILKSEAGNRFYLPPLILRALGVGEGNAPAHDVLQFGKFQPFKVSTPAHFRTCPRTDIQHPAVQHIVHSAKSISVHTPATITQFVLILDHADLLFGIGGQDIEDDTDELFFRCPCHNCIVFSLVYASSMPFFQ